ncbi:MAG: hypothetical protein EBX50_22455, partial [Chitinophagia bacterium]|nr:hypothetical protein [Chitinophagia bacterium]
NQCRASSDPLNQVEAGTPLLISEDWLQELLSNPATARTLGEFPGFRTSVDVRFVDKNRLDIPALLAGSPETAEWQNAVWLNQNGNVRAGAEGFEFKTRSEVEKMSKSKRNVVNPDSVVEQYGADTLRLYELFLGPLEDAKPWDTQGIEGVYRFLQKVNRHFRSLEIHTSEPDDAAQRILHRCLRRVHDGLERMALNTCVSAMMIGMNEIQSAGIFHRQILEAYVRMLAPFAPHLAEELWHKCILEVRKQYANILKEKGTNDYKFQLLIDGNYFNPITYLNKKTNKIESMPYITIEGGDNKYSSIAAASILAKVERDKYIDLLCEENPELCEKYGIDTNKGYGAKKHLDGIKEHGITIWHRRSFGICKTFSL